MLSPFNIEDDYFSDSIKLSVNGTEQKVCNKDLIYKIFEYINEVKRYPKARKDIGEIFYLYFVKEFTMDEIGKKKNCTRANISLVIKNEIPKIQKHFNNKEKIQ